MRDKNSSLFILLLKLVNFNNTFACLLYFFFCQDTSGKMFPSIRQNKFPPNYVTFAIRQNFFSWYVHKPNIWGLRNKYNQDTNLTICTCAMEGDISTYNFTLQYINVATLHKIQKYTNTQENHWMDFTNTMCTNLQYEDSGRNTNKMLNIILKCP